MLSNRSNGPRGAIQSSLADNFTEVVKEEIAEDEGADGNTRGRQVRLKVIEDGNEFGSKTRRTRSTELRTRQLIVNTNNIGNVSEVEDEN